MSDSVLVPTGPGSGMTWVSSVAYTADAVGEVSLHVVGGGKRNWAACCPPSAECSGHLPLDSSDVAVIPAWWKCHAHRRGLSAPSQGGFWV